MQDLLAPVFAPESAFSVGDLNAHIKRVLQSEPILCDIAVAGEISNFGQSSSRIICGRAIIARRRAKVNLAETKKHANLVRVLFCLVGRRGCSFGNFGRDIDFTHDARWLSHPIPCG